MQVRGEFSKAYEAGLYPLKPHFPYALYYNEELERNVPVLLRQRTHAIDDDNDDVEPHEFDGEFEYYDAERHDGHLKCPGAGCCAELHYNKGKEGRAGNSAFVQSGHWKTNSDTAHNDDCNFKAAPREEHIYNDELGYRVHVNLKRLVNPHQLSAVFKESASIYYLGEKGRPKLKAEYKATDEFPHLEDMRSFEIHEPKNFLTLVRRGNFDRLTKSAFINHDHILTAEEFIIRYSRNSADPEFRYLNLFSRLSDLRHGQYLPCLMEFTVEKGTSNREPNERHSILSKPIFHSQERMNGKYDAPKHYIVPRALPSKGLEEDVWKAFAEPGRYLVLGYVSLAEPLMNGNAAIHYMDIKITDTDQILKADLSEILQKTLKKHPASLNLKQSVNPA